ncbi:hypothetical protein ABZZ80_02500 [Streptomyces sp. NPDC006356]
MPTDTSALVTISFTRPVHAHELRPGDVFTFTDAPTTPLLVDSVTESQISSELSLLAIKLTGTGQQITLPANTPVRARRMVRTVRLPCLLCREEQEFKIDLPRDGEPLSAVCGKHTQDISTSGNGGQR